MSTPSTPVFYTNLYPTRYTVFETPGAFHIFRPDEEGNFYHGTKDSKRSIQGFTNSTEIAVYIYTSQNNGNETVYSCTIGFYRGGRYDIDCHVSPQSGPQRGIGLRSHSIMGAIILACDWLQIPKPDFSQVPNLEIIDKRYVGTPST